MLAYAIDVPPPSTIVLITGDRDFAYALSVLKLRRYHIVLITLPNAHTTITYQASQCFDWIQDVINAPSMQTAHSSPLSPQNISEPADSSGSESEEDDQDQSKEDLPSSSGSSRSTSPLARGESPSSDDHSIRPAFLPLLKVLQSNRKEGQYCPLRSKIAVELIKEHEGLYQDAGVNSFKKYITMAENEGLVILGGFGGQDWVSLKPRWHHVHVS